MSAEWGKVLIDFDRVEHNNDQTEHRRHISLDLMNYEGELFADYADAPGHEDFSLQLAIAAESLLPQQQALLKKVLYYGLSITEIAKQEGVGESAIRDRLKRIYKKIEKYLE